MHRHSLGYALAVLLPVGLTACDEGDAPAGGAAEERGPPGKGDGWTGSCGTAKDAVDHCGGQSAGDCWCDEACVEYGDCCRDYDAVCGGDDPPPISAGCDDYPGLQGGAPWPTEDRCPSRQRLSPLLGPDSPVVLWRIGDGGPWSDPAIGADGTVYAAGGLQLIAVDSEGAQQWFYDAGSYLGSPTIGADGAVYITSAQTLSVLNPDGSLRWAYDSDDRLRGVSAIDEDGNVYLAGDDLQLLDRDGNELWEYSLNQVLNPPVVAPDGAAFVNDRAQLYALNPSGTGRWVEFFDDLIYAAYVPAARLMLLPDQSITVTTTDPWALHRIDPPGATRWRIETEIRQIAEAIAPDGTIIVRERDKLFARRPEDGTVRWTYDYRGRFQRPSVDANGTIYAAVRDTFFNSIVAIDIDGELKWELPNVAGGAISIGADQTLILGGPSLYAIGEAD